MSDVQQALSVALQQASTGQLTALQSFAAQVLGCDAPRSVQLDIANGCLSYGLVSSARQLYESVVQDNPNDLAAQAGLARIATDTGEHATATTIYTKLVKQYPNNDMVRRNALVALQYDPAVSEPERLQCASQWGQWAVRRAGGSRPRPPIAALGERAPRVGFVSADFCQHTVGLFVKDILITLGQRWPVYVYHSRDLQDWVSKLIQSRCHWRCVADLDDQALADQIIQDDIDILVDLSGHTAGSRLTALAWRPAPVMVSWLGYFATTGLAYLDGLLMDSWHVPAQGQAQFSEPVIHLPSGRFFYKPAPWAPKAVAPAPCLSRGHITFGCFNNTAKLNEAVIDVWALVLHAVAHSRLILKWRTFNDVAYRDTIEAAFAVRGIDAARIEYRGSGFHVDVLNEYADIDIALDPFPFVGGVTSCEALWMGVPVVTWPQSAVVSRQTFALLSAIGSADTVADSADAYVRIASQLAARPAHLADLRTQLRAQMASSKLMDLDAHVSGLQQTLLSIHQHVLSQQERAGSSER